MPFAQHTGPEAGKSADFGRKRERRLDFQPIWQADGSFGIVDQRIVPGRFLKAQRCLAVTTLYDLNKGDRRKYSMSLFVAVVGGAS